MLPTARSILHYPTTPSFRADTQAWLDVATGNYSTAERQALDALLGGFATDGILFFDRLYLLQFGDNAADSLRCIVSRQSATSAGATPPVFTRRQGWLGNLTTGFINTNWAPSSGVNFQLDNCSIGCYVRRVTTATTGFRALMGGQNSTTQIVLLGQIAGTTESVHRLNSSTISQISAPLIPIDNSYVSISRALSTIAICRRDDVEVSSDRISTSLGTAALTLLARNNNGTRDGFANNGVSLAHMGAAQTTAQNASFRSRVNTFNTAIGFVP